VGFGLDAHSFDDGLRWANSDDMSAYLAGHRDPAFSTDEAEEHMFVGLRLSQGVAPTPAERARFAEPIERWKAAGLLEDSAGFLRLSDRGVLLSNEVLQDFVNA
jgi:oxygen-independent coproporphyrinogen-3 oxidase